MLASLHFDWLICRIRFYIKFYYVTFLLLHYPRAGKWQYFLNTETAVTTIKTKILAELKNNLLNLSYIKLNKKLIGFLQIKYKNN